MEQKQAEKLTEEFFKRRFPDKDIAFEKRCGYFYEWLKSFKSGRPEDYMDEVSLAIWKEMQLKMKLTELIKKKGVKK